MDLDEFRKKVESQIGRRKKEEEENQTTIEESMRLLEEKRNDFNKRVSRLLFSDVRDRLKELGQNFDNIKIHSGEKHCTAEFAHTKKYPCTATLCFSVSPGSDIESFIVRYDCTVLPVFADYGRNDEQEFPFTESGKIKALSWVETRILEFLDNYLEIGSHPAYQKGNMVTDPVCGMVLSAASAADSIKIDERKTVYFCSTTCRTAYDSNVSG
jgi:YHS domain-containing protein